MKKFICILLALMPLLAFAKDDKKKGDNYNPKYLVGAVTLTDGKVVFSKTVDVPSLSKEFIYQKLLNWGKERFQGENGLHSDVVYTNEEKGQIAANSEEYITFSSSALSLDRTRIYYNFSMFVSDGQFRMDMDRIRYWYEENRDGGSKYTAEEWIVDDIALAKKKTKLAPICGKFRRETVDLKDELFKGAIEAVTMQSVTMNENQTVANTNVAQPIVPTTPTPAPVVTPAVSTVKKELTAIKLTQLPSNLNEIAANGRITITAGEEEVDVKAEAWGGFGKLFNQDVAYTLIDKSRLAASLIMEQSDTYKISFYQKGSAEPVIVIECKKSMKQELTSEELKSLNQHVDMNKKYTMYIGSVTKCLMR